VVDVGDLVGRFVGDLVGAEVEELAYTTSLFLTKTRRTPTQ
jgi:hypothetical protein